MVHAELEVNGKHYVLRLYPSTHGELNIEKGKHYILNLHEKPFEELAEYISTHYTIF